MPNVPPKLSNEHKAKLGKYFRGDIRYETAKQNLDILRPLYAEMIFYLKDDNEKAQPLEREYLRDGSLWHCGKPYKNLEGRKYCEVCGYLK